MDELMNEAETESEDSYNKGNTYRRRQYVAGIKEDVNNIKFPTPKRTGPVLKQC